MWMNLVGFRILILRLYVKFLDCAKWKMVTEMFAWMERLLSYN